MKVKINQENPLECPICHKVFGRSAETERHYRVHTKEKPFKCLHSSCNRYFSRRDNMMQHFKCHNSGGYISRREEQVHKYRDTSLQLCISQSLSTSIDVNMEKTKTKTKTKTITPSFNNTSFNLSPTFTSTPTSTPTPTFLYNNHLSDTGYFVSNQVLTTQLPSVHDSIHNSNREIENRLSSSSNNDLFSDFKHLPLPSSSKIKSSTSPSLCQIKEPSTCLPSIKTLFPQHF